MKTTELRTELAREREVSWELKKELLHLRTLLKTQTAAKPVEEARAFTPSDPPVAEETPVEAAEDDVEPDDAAEIDPPEEPRQPQAVPVKPEANTRKPDTSKSFGELRQTGLDEYLAMHSQSESYIVVTPFDDEP